MLRLLVVDDHPLLRTGLVTALAAEADLQVVGEAADAAQGIALAETHAPELVVLDLALPDASGLHALRRIHQSNPQVRVLVFTMHNDRRYVSDALEAGASGYVLKQEPTSTVVEAIRSVARGRIFLSPRLGLAQPTAAAPGPIAHDSHGARRIEALSARERRVFELAVAGRTNREIAEELSLSLKTVQTHRTKVNRKLGAHSTADLVRIAARRGMLRD